MHSDKNRLATKEKEAATQGRIDVTHRRYRVIAGYQAETGVAIAYLGMRKIETVRAGNVTEALEALKGTLDRRFEHLRSERSGEVPSEAEYDEALQVLRADVPEQSMALLLLLCRLPEVSATLPELALRLGRSEPAVTTEAARLGRRLGALLDFAPDPEGLDRLLAPVLSFARVSRIRPGSPQILRLRPEIVAPLRGLGQGEARALR
ncbi:MAG: hypothetical protein WD100_09335 [Tistlia sp.]|uniref:hypothetical protein n=1 Tax=Tistlia sp. TaxID=3057121 RepID=UPI0034A21BF5